jgi:peptidoglycan/xylan/chitin deacetylase (PgdA/CDA1 family)
MNMSPKQFILRPIYLIVAVISYLFRYFLGLRRLSCIVLCYHGIIDTQRNRFRNQMERLSRRFRPFTIRQSDDIWPSHGVAVTFDDAFANLVDNAIPFLEQSRFPAMIFAVADNLGCSPKWRMPRGHPEANESTMTAEQLQAVSKNPLIRIGSHTMTHPDLATIPEDQLRFELAESKRRLEGIVGCPVEDLALPHGSYNDQVIVEAIRAGYKRIYTLDPRPYDPSSANPVIGRFSMSPDVWKLEFRLTCAGAYSWLYSWRKVVRGIRTGLSVRK